MGCVFSNKKQIISKPEKNTNNTNNIKINDTDEFNYLMNKINDSNPKYEIINNDNSRNIIFNTRRFLQKIIIIVHNFLLLNTEYSNYEHSDSKEFDNIYKLKCIKSNKNEISYKLDSYKFTFIFLNYERVNLHIHFKNHVFNQNVYAIKNKINGEQLIKKYVSNIDFCTFTNLNYSLNGYFDWSKNFSYKQSTFNINCLNNLIEVFVIVPIDLHERQHIYF
jgi:hypothetical protein